MRAGDPFEDIVRNLKSLARGGLLTYQELNEALPADFGVERLDEVLDLLEESGIRVVEKRTAPAVVAGRDGRPVIRPGSDDRAWEVVEPSGPESGDELWELLDRKARRMARRYLRSGVSFEDLYQAAMEAFSHSLAAQGRPADPERFAAACMPRVRRALGRCIRENLRHVRIPQSYRRLMRRYLETYDLLCSEAGETPSLRQVASRLGVDVEELHLLKALYSAPVSLFTPVGEEDGQLLMDVLPDDAAPEGQRRMEELLGRERVDALLSGLPLLERRVLSLRYGLEDGVRRSVGEAAAMLGISAEKLEGIEAAALLRLRRGMDD